jgi:SAM-dependent methyltransferase
LLTDRSSAGVRRNTSTVVETVPIRRTLNELAANYPPGLRQQALLDVERQVFHLSLIAADRHRDVADIGGGMGLFSIGCAAMGKDVRLIDDFSDPSNATHGNSPLVQHRALGVVVDSRDVIAEGLGISPGSMDVITSFDSMEHWHASPKDLFREVMGALRPGGAFLLGVPNCVSLRKRLTVPLGRGKWSSMDAWYEQRVFRGHVREPDVDDLRYIAQDMGLTGVEIFGRNWQGYRSQRRWVASAVPLADQMLRLRPGLCSDLYLWGLKPA